SQADRDLTHRLKDALALVDVRVLDHFVVGDGEPLSLAEYGWL
ncbi:JAB domain-containing protein, partial [Metapseudomonas otitidis]